MSAKTAVEVKARLLDLTTGVLELARDGNRDAESVCEVLQIIKDDPLFTSRFFADVSSQLQDWQSFYKKFFGLDTDFSGIRIPERKPGFDRLLVPAQGLTPNVAVSAYRKLGIKVWLYTENLDSALDWSKEERNAKNGSYAIWVKDRQEADEELKNLSANQIKEGGLTTETLTERLIHGLVYHSETNHHLDEANVTLCSGSRDQGSDVPSVCWSGYDGEVCVHWDDPDDSADGLRSRQVVRP